MESLIWRLRRAIKAFKHATSKCFDEHCALCAVLDCPNNAHEHYWHDGCPVCWTNDTNGYKTNYLKKQNERR